MADANNKTAKKTLRLKTSRPAAPAAENAGEGESDIRDVAHAPVMASMGSQAGPVAGPPPTAAAIVAVVAVLIFTAIVILQVMEWQLFANPSVFPQ
jgi:hypothetical protein